ncbi:hypothetical protein V6N13_113657 [Hibiscus sabdariffa]|uniref:Uncharacterized protein n=1 Tax=Hibiscus sabdariffa TaxID=183260 RepID=A0ABR2U010_9ROSI
MILRPKFASNFHRGPRHAETRCPHQLRIEGGDTGSAISNDSRWWSCNKQLLFSRQGEQLPSLELGFTKQTQGNAMVVVLLEFCLYVTVVRFGMILRPKFASNFHRGPRHAETRCPHQLRIEGGDTGSAISNDSRWWSCNKQLLFSRQGEQLPSLELGFTKQTQGNAMVVVLLEFCLYDVIVFKSLATSP